MLHMWTPATTPAVWNVKFCDVACTPHLHDDMLSPAKLKPLCNYPRGFVALSGFLLVLAERATAHMVKRRRCYNQELRS